MREERIGDGERRGVVMSSGRRLLWDRNPAVVHSLFLCCRFFMKADLFEV